MAGSLGLCASCRLVPGTLHASVRLPHSTITHTYAHGQLTLYCLLYCPLYCLPPRRFSLYEPVEFVRHFLLDKLEFSKVRDSVAVHIPCSSKKMGIEEAFMKVGPALCCAVIFCG